MNQDNQTTTIFDLITPTINEIANKYNIKEDKKDAIKKINQGEPLQLGFIIKTSRDYIQKKISEDEVVNLLKKNLQVTEEISKQIFLDIKVKLIPILEKISLTLEEKTKPIGEPTNKAVEEKDLDLFPKINPLTNIEKQTVPTPIKRTRGKSTLPSKKLNEQTLSGEIEKNIPQSKQPKGPDSYREPIE